MAFFSKQTEEQKYDTGWGRKIFNRMREIQKGGDKTEVSEIKQM